MARKDRFWAGSFIIMTTSQDSLDFCPTCNQMYDPDADPHICLSPTGMPGGFSGSPGSTLVPPGMAPNTITPVVPAQASISPPESPTIEITDSDIENLFTDEDKAPEPDFHIIDDQDYWWMQRGECPVCKDGSKPESMPGGSFLCPKCNWRS